MITITAQKPIEEIIKSMGKCDGVFLIGCGTCPTMLHTGGKLEVLDMKERLEASGKKVTGWMVIPTACDELSRDALKESADVLKQSDCILALSCAFGVQTIGRDYEKPVYPALNTLFIGKEEGDRSFSEICAQCGDCVLARTGGICPVVRCAKGLFNGPCGGSVGGKCEVDPNIPCAWQQIIDRLTELGQMDRLEEIEPPKDWSASRSGGPRTITVKS